MFNKAIKITAFMVLLLGVSLSSPITAHAQSGYKITSTQDVTPEPYHIANNIKSHYSWDKTHTKKMTILNQLGDISLYVTQKVTMSHNGQEIAYFHITDVYGGNSSYVTAGSLVKGVNAADDERPVYQPEVANHWNGNATIPVNSVSKKSFAKVSKKIVKNQYYQAKRSVKVKIPFTTYLNAGDINKTVVLPAGTVINGDKNSKWLTINGAYLSQKFLKVGYHQGLWADAEHWPTSALSKDFKPVKHPSYLPKSISHGDLYLGSLSAIQHYDSLSKQSIQITSDGYVEIHQNHPWGSITEYQGQPTVSVKINRTRIKGHTRYLYLAKPLNGFKTTKVRYHGKHQYRIAFVNQQKTYSESRKTEDHDLPAQYYGIISFGGKTFYTPYGIIPYDD